MAGTEPPAFSPSCSLKLALYRKGAGEMMRGEALNAGCPESRAQVGRDPLTWVLRPQDAVSLLAGRRCSWRQDQVEYFLCTPLISSDLLVGAGDTCWCPAGPSSDGEACSGVCTILVITDVSDWLSNGLLQHCRVCLALQVNCEELGR